MKLRDTALTLLIFVQMAATSVADPGQDNQATAPQSTLDNPSGEGDASVGITDVSPEAKEAFEEFQSENFERAIELAAPLAESGNADAQYLMGVAFESGNGVEPSAEKSLELYRKAADQKNRRAILRLSRILLASEEVVDRNEAKQLLEGLAISDPAVAGRLLGEAYIRGLLSDEPDFDQAVSWWKAASDAEDTDAQLLLGRLYDGQFGFQERADEAKSIESFMKAAKAGNSLGMLAVGSRLVSGSEAIRDVEQGKMWLNKAIEGEQYSAYLSLGDYEEVVNEDSKAALAFYEKGKDVGQPDCMLRAASYYIGGVGTEKDVKRGLAILQKAAKDGVPAADYQLAMYYLSQESVDSQKVYGHLLTAAIANIPQAQNELGIHYLYGRMGKADSVAAVAWFNRAARAGSPQARANLGYLYEQGEGVRQDFESARQLYNLAMESDHGPGYFGMARLHATGRGVDKNLAKAWYLTKMAIKLGDREADQFLSALEQQISEEDRAAGEKLFEEAN